MPRDAVATRTRLLAAATAEFARYGLAGARVDRIAAQAGASKALLYAYFGNKEQLFDAVFAAVVERVVTNVPIDASDLAGYAVRLFDLYQQRPEILRLASWHTLERGPTSQTPESFESNRLKVAAVARAQAEGRVSSRYHPAELLALVLSIAATGILERPEGSASVANLARRRRAIAAAVQQLAAP